MIAIHPGSRSWWGTSPRPSRSVRVHGTTVPRPLRVLIGADTCPPDIDGAARLAAGLAAPTAFPVRTDSAPACPARPSPGRSRCCGRCARMPCTCSRPSRSDAICSRLPSASGTRPWPPTTPCRRTRCSTPPGAGRARRSGLAVGPAGSRPRPRGCRCGHRAHAPGGRAARRPHGALGPRGVLHAGHRRVAEPGDAGGDGSRAARGGRRRRRAPAPRAPRPAVPARRRDRARHGAHLPARRSGDPCADGRGSPGGGSGT